VRASARVHLVATIVAVLTVPAVGASAQEVTWGGSIRAFQFVQTETTPETGTDRRDAELAILRLTSEVWFAGTWRLLTHGVLTFRSPAVTGVEGIADFSPPAFLPLQTTVAEGRHAALLAELDRLNIQGNIGRLRVIGGRQAITWGTNYFWPALDLFAPFRPFQIDRDYKPGVDAVRLTLPVGAFSEIEAVGAVLGDSRRRDGAAGVLARIHLGRADVGAMGGYFHEDSVVGGFVTADMRGTGVRGEITRTYSGDPEDVLRGRERFWRASVGIDRLLAPVLTVMLEAAFNGYGFDDPALYPLLANADRTVRGEVTALGRRHAGLSLDWQIHPLWRLVNSMLASLTDGSALWAPTVRWSTSDETEVLFGAQVSLGQGRDDRGLPQSEYGLAPTTLIVSFRGYF
jgi:hypothetical protein